MTHPDRDPVDALSPEEIDGLWAAEPRRLVVHTPEPAGLTRDAAPRERSRFRTYTTKQLRALPPLDWLVPGMIPAGGLVAVIGAPKSGKTFVVLDLANCVAAGRPFLGRPTRQGGVLYLSAEGRAGLPARQAAWTQANGVRDDALDLVFVLEGANLLEHEDAWHLARAAIDSLATPPALVVIDTLARVTPGAEENSATDIGLVVQHADWVRERTGAAVLLVHHTNATGERERGSTALRGAVDALLLVADEDGRRIVTCEAIKDGEPFEPITVELQPVALPGGLTSCVPHLSAAHWSDAPVPPEIDAMTTSQIKALAALELAGDAGATWTQWKDTAGLALRTFNRAIAALVAGEYVALNGSRYTLNPFGMGALRYARRPAEKPPAAGAAGGATVPPFSATASAISSATEVPVGATGGAMGGVGGGSFTTENLQHQAPQGLGAAVVRDLDKERRARGTSSGTNTGTDGTNRGTSGGTRGTSRGPNGASSYSRNGVSGRDRAAGAEAPPPWIGPKPWEDD